MGTHVTPLSSSGTVLPLTLTYAESLGLYLIVLTSVISGEALHIGKH